MYHVFPLRLLMSAKGLRFMSLHREPCAATALFCRENIRSAGLVNLVWEARQLRHEFLQSGFGQPTRRNLGSNTQRSSDSLGNARTLTSADRATNGKLPLARPDGLGDKPR